MSEDFAELLKSYLSLVERKTEQEADALVKKYPGIVRKGALSGNWSRQPSHYILRKPGAT